VADTAREGACMNLQGEVRSEQGYISGVLVIKRVRNQGMSLFATVVISLGDCLLVQLTYFGEGSCRKLQHNTQFGGC